MFETIKLNNGLTVLAKTDKKHGLGAKTFANRTQAHKALEALKGIERICHVTYSRPFYVVVRPWEEAFGECCQEFKAEIERMAGENGKSVCQVFAWWREYSDACQSGDQSAILWEFERWYESKLKAA